MNASTSTPTRAFGRIASIDVVRGVAVLGIFSMNIVAFAMVEDAYYAPVGLGDEQPWNQIIFGLNYWFADQKFMGIFSALFGAGIVMLTDRLQATGRPVVRIFFTRNLWLLVFGILHFIFLFEGDVLTVYALCGFFLYLLRRLPNWVLLPLGLAVYWVFSFWVVGAEVAMGDDSAPEIAEILYAIDGLARAAGMMLVGMALFRWGVFTGQCGMATLRRLAVYCLAIGVPIVGLGVIAGVATQWDGLGLVVAALANNLATPAMSVGYIAAIVWWATGPGLNWLQKRLASVGRMALTNYLLESVIGVLLFSVWGFALAEQVTRVELLAVVGVVWIVLLLGSPWWLNRFRYGPMEWLWRSLTYWKAQPMRRSPTDSS